MTDIEKILAEIQKRIEFQKTCIKNNYRLTGRAEEEIIFEYQKLINIINSFPKESISEKKCMYSNDNYTDEDRKVLCDGCEEECKFNKKEGSVSEELETAIDTYLATYFGGEKEKQEWPYLKKMAIHFAEWQKDQLMKKAVNGFVIEDIEEGNGDFLLSADYLSKDIGLKDRQKVKVIVIKETEL